MKVCLLSSILSRGFLGLLALFTIGLLLAGAPSAHAQLFVSNKVTSKITTYNEITGAAKNLNFLTLPVVASIAVGGGRLYVSEVSTVAAYTAATGSLISSPLISGLATPVGLIVLGSDLYEVNYTGGTVGKYTTDGVVQNAAVAGSLQSPTYVAVDGIYLYVTNYANGTVGKYTTSGGVVNATFISGLANPTGIVVTNGRLYVADYTSDRVGVYNATTGTAINANFITGLDGPFPLALSGSRLLVGNYDSGAIATYDTTTGAAINPSFIISQAGVYGLAIAPLPAPSVGISGRRVVTTNRSHLVVKGFSTGATKVEVKVRNGAYKLAKGTAKWSYRARLSRGINRITVRAENENLVDSTLAKITVRRTVH